MSQIFLTPIRMIKPLWQKDPLWGKYRIGNSAATLYRYGCYIMCLCMGLHKLRGYPCDPLDAIRFWDFTEQGLLMGSTKFKGMEIIKKVSYYDKKEVEEYANSDDKVAILVLDNGDHFIYVDKVVDGRMTVVDPLYEGFTTKISGVITGMRLYKTVEIEPSDWAKKFWEKAKEKGLNLKSPLVKLDAEKMLECWLDMGLIDKPKKEITGEEFVVAMEKISERW